jgi:GTP-binding protein HflX
VEQAKDVDIVLARLEKETGLPLPPMIEAWNKSDILAPERFEALEIAAKGNIETPAVLVSALQGSRMDALLHQIERALLRGARDVAVTLSPQDGRARAWLHSHGDVNAETNLSDGRVALSVRLPIDRVGQFQAEFPNVAIDD